MISKRWIHWLDFLLRTNIFFPLNPVYQTWFQRYCILMILVVLLFSYSLSSYLGSNADLYDPDVVSEESVDEHFIFDEMQLGYWDYLRVYRFYKAQLDPYYKILNPNVSNRAIVNDCKETLRQIREGEKSFWDFTQYIELASSIPRYPRFNHLFKDVLGVKNLPPTNAIESHIPHLRLTIGSGIDIVDKNGFILKSTPNSRQFIPANQIPDSLKEVFIHAEDHFFHLEPGGINPIRLALATFFHVAQGSTKGNSSIAEQVFKHYFGNSDKSVQSKVLQIFGAVYLTQFCNSRDDILNLYAQSIPGAYWGGHCYGVYSICNNYLQHTDFKNLSPLEKAWIGRLALLPGVHGTEFANYHSVRKIVPIDSYNWQQMVAHLFEIKDWRALHLSNQYLEQLDHPFELYDKLFNHRKKLEDILYKEDILNEPLVKHLNWWLKEVKEKNVTTSDATRLLLSQGLKQLGIPFSSAKSIDISTSQKAVNFVRKIRILGWFEELQEAKNKTISRLETILYDFVTGNPFLPPLISAEEYDATMRILAEMQGGWGPQKMFSILSKPYQSCPFLVFYSPRIISNYPTYTDQTLIDLRRQLGEWALNIGLKVRVAFDKKTQDVMDRELETTIIETNKTYAQDQTEKYGGASVMLKTHSIRDGTLQNKIAAISSQHPEYTAGNTYINWATDGLLRFGSIYKWLIMTLYFEKGGTPFDTYYDIPRDFDDGRTQPYQPENVKKSWKDFYGAYTYSLESMVQNFIKSKNVTFVYVSNLIGLNDVADFLNLISEYDKRPLDEQFKPYLSTTLGTMETSAVTFAQMLSIISNRGLLRPLSTIECIYEYDGTLHNIDNTLKIRRIVSREAAEQSLWLGYLNPFGGTAHRFFDGGIAKTGSSDRSAGFVAMTGKTSDEYIPEEPDSIHNSNMLYLTCVGVNRGKASRALYGGKAGAMNARNVFKEILEVEEDEKLDKVIKMKYPIAGDLKKTFSDKFQWRYWNYLPRIGKVSVPMLKDAKPKGDAELEIEDLQRIKMEYCARRVEYLCKHPWMIQHYYDIYSSEGGNLDVTGDDETKISVDCPIDMVLEAYANCANINELKESWIQEVSEDFTLEKTLEDELQELEATGQITAEERNQLLKLHEKYEESDTTPTAIREDIHRKEKEVAPTRSEADWINHLKHLAQRDSNSNAPVFHNRKPKTTPGDENEASLLEESIPETPYEQILSVLDRVIPEEIEPLDEQEDADALTAYGDRYDLYDDLDDRSDLHRVNPSAISREEMTSYLHRNEENHRSHSRKVKTSTNASGDGNDTSDSNSKEANKDPRALELEPLVDEQGVPIEEVPMEDAYLEEETDDNSTTTSH